MTADAPEIPVGVDGEALMLRTPVRCAIRPGALRVRVPRDRPGRLETRPPLDWRSGARVWPGAWFVAPAARPRRLESSTAGRRRAGRRPDGPTRRIAPQDREAVRAGRLVGPSRRPGAGHHGPRRVPGDRHRADAVAGSGPGPAVPCRRPLEALAGWRGRAGRGRRPPWPAGGTRGTGQCRRLVSGHQHPGQVAAAPAAPGPHRRRACRRRAGYACRRRGRSRPATAPRRSRSPRRWAPPSRCCHCRYTWPPRPWRTRGYTPACTIPATQSPEHSSAPWPRPSSDGRLRLNRVGTAKRH